MSAFAMTANRFGLGARPRDRAHADPGAHGAMIETGGWDTHSAQTGRLNAQLGGLDQMVVMATVLFPSVSGARFDETLIRA